MDNSQRKKLFKRSTKREFKQSPVLNLYILILSILIPLIELLGWSTLLYIIKPLNAALLCIYIFSKLPQTRSFYIIAKAFYFLNLIRQLIVLFHQEESPTKLFFYITLITQQIINLILLKSQFCITAIGFLNLLLVYCSGIAFVVFQILMIKSVYPYIRINKCEYLYFIAFAITITPVVSLRRCKYTTSRSFWFCLIGNVLIWLSMNLYCYQQLIGQKDEMLKGAESLAGGVGNFVLMHGFVLHFMFRKEMMKNEE